MKCHVGLGTNLGDRRANLERAGHALRSLSKGRAVRAAPIYETPAMVPPGAPLEWRIPFLNSVVELDFDGSPRDLLYVLKKIESEMGRTAAPRWSPRIIDLDLLTFGAQIIEEQDFRVPHAGIKSRSFVLRPLRDLDPTLCIPSLEENPTATNVTALAKRAPDPSPLWMGIVNLTPDSFSDGGTIEDTRALERRFEAFDSEGVQIFDFGAESTRPSASPVTADEEWTRLRGALEIFRDLYADRVFRPLVSVDTRHASTAVRSLELGADWINDVSALSDPAMLDVILGSRASYVLMHSLTVPPTADAVLPLDRDPSDLLVEWCQDKLASLSQLGIALDRVLFDPGIGFGKTPHQSLALLKTVERLRELPVRLLIGHSRKSFMNLWGQRDARDRDYESLGISLQLASRGVDVIRVHDAHLHARTQRAFAETRP